MAAGSPPSSRSFACYKASAVCCCYRAPSLDWGSSEDHEAPRAVQLTIAWFRSSIKRHRREIICDVKRLDQHWSERNERGLKLTTEGAARRMSVLSIVERYLAERSLRCSEGSKKHSERDKKAKFVIETEKIC